MDNSEILIKTLQKENELIKEYCDRLKAEQEQKEIEHKMQLDEKEQQRQREVESIRNEEKEIQKKLDSILYSRSYKAMQKIKKIIRR